MLTCQALRDVQHRSATQETHPPRERLQKAEMVCNKDSISDHEAGGPTTAPGAPRAAAHSTCTEWWPNLGTHPLIQVTLEPHETANACVVLGKME